jgi:hypothetical protein
MQMATTTGSPGTAHFATAPTEDRWRARYSCALFLCGTSLASAAGAHVKWFAPYDIAKAPTPIGEVITPVFVRFFLLSAALIYLFYLADRFVKKHGYFSALDARLRKLDRLSIAIMRLCAGVFFVSVAAFGWTHQGAFLLTPELTTAQPAIPWVQLCIGLCALHRRLVPAIGIGIIALYAASVLDYGFYHMLDYVIFLGIAYFFLVAHLTSPAWRKSAFVVLYACVGITLLWASIEKFAYPYWTYPLLEKDPSMLMGLSPYTYLILAGFVEFSVAFVVLSAASVFARVVALGLQSIFVLAIYKFGLVDAIGHLLIIAILLVLVVRGPTEARNMLVLSAKSVWVEAYFMTGLYFLAFVTFFIMYYGFHFLAYGN